MKKRTAILAISALLAATSCSIKESRLEMPSFVWSEISSFTEAGDSRIYELTAFTDEDFVFDYNYVSREEFLHFGYVPVPKKDPIYVTGLAGIARMTVDRAHHSLVIPLGHSCDSLYICRDAVDGNNEISAVNGNFHKEFARLRIDMKAHGEESYPYTTKINGKVYGYDLVTGKPLVGNEGDFKAIPDSTGVGLFYSVLPRQVDNTIALELWGDERKIYGDESSPEGVRIIDSLPLGVFIQQLGYDWTAEDLADIDVEIDYAKSHITITVADWDLGASFDFTI